MSAILVVLSTLQMRLIGVLIGVRLARIRTLVNGVLGTLLLLYCMIEV
jgi:hypothetical protein